MITTNHTTLRMNGALNIEHLTSLKLHVGVNAHGWAIVEGEAGENALEQLSGALAGREQNILTLDETGVEKCLFAGVIREAELVRVCGYNRFHVELLSGTCLMDREVRSRSFQDVGRTYSQVAGQVCSEYSGGAAICTVGEDKTLGKPVIQYRETDWEFLMRMTSHCGGVLVPETHRGLPRLWFGFPERSFTCEFPEDAYTSGISQRYYELGGSAAGYSKADFFYYDVESPQLCDLGWYTVFKGQPFIISEKSARLECGELIFTYRLGRPGLGWGKMLYNEKISGMTLLGEVLETSRETLKLKLDIDAGWNPGGPYPYTWRPETGNFMYCMPKVGTRVSLYCPNYDEKAAIAVNCVRTNGGDCDRMSDPAKRSFVTEHEKEMNLYPDEMSLIGGSMGNVLGNILVSDDNGILFATDKAIIIAAIKDVVLEAATAFAQANVGEVVTEICNIQTGDVKASVMQSGQYDLSALATNAVGCNCVEYAPCNDEPQESSFDVGGLFLGIVAGLAAVAIVALACTGIGLLAVGTGLMAASTASAMVTGAIVGGCVAVGSCAIGDILTGEVSSVGDYFFSGLSGATTGAIFGGVSSSKFFLKGIPKLFQSKFLIRAARVGVMGGTGFVTGAGTNIARQLWNGSTWSEINWSQVLSTGTFNGVTSALFFWGSDKLMQLKPVQQFIHKLNGLPLIKQLVKWQSGLTNFFQNNGAKISAFLNGGTSQIPTVSQLSGKAMQWWEETKSTYSSNARKQVNKVSVVFDAQSGKYYYGVNREYLGLGVKDARISTLWPDGPLNEFLLGNCAENAAIYKALQGGANLDDLYLCTINLNKNAKDLLINACENCTYAFKGAVADGLSGWVIDWQGNLFSVIAGVEAGTEEEINE
ncbi:hypothetical protein D7V91_12020 [bacterium 1xD42-67]|nr:hypothetical protein D7V91_12020 [bacterium 1xD42-67]